MHMYAHTLAVPGDHEEPPGLSHASCFHCMAQKQRREEGAVRQPVIEQEKRKERREGEPGNVREMRLRAFYRKKYFTKVTRVGKHMSTFY